MKFSLTEEVKKEIKKLIREELKKMRFPIAISAKKLRGIPINRTAPSDKQVLTYLSSKKSWIPQDPTGAGFVDPYYVLTKPYDELVNARIHPNTGTPNFNVKHEFADISGIISDVQHGNKASIPKAHHDPDLRVLKAGDTMTGDLLLQELDPEAPPITLGVEHKAKEGEYGFYIDVFKDHLDFSTCEPLGKSYFGISIKEGFPPELNLRFDPNAILSFRPQINDWSLRLGSETREGGDIEVFRDSSGNRQLLLDADALEDEVGLALHGKARIGATNPVELDGKLGTVDGVDVSLLKPHAIDDETYHSGIISDAQHGTKTSIPNAHHPRVHTHAINATYVADLSEKSTTTVEPNWDVLCYTPPIYEVGAGFIVFVVMTCNFRTSSTLEQRGADLSLWRGDGSGWGIPDVQLTTAMKIAYSDTFWKILSYTPTAMESAGFSELDYVICWRAQNASYPSYSKNNYMSFFITQTG